MQEQTIPTYSSLFTDKDGKAKIFSVAQLSNILKQTIESGFSKVRIRGEITGLKKHQNGHYYFDLKEQVSGKDFIINGVLWKWTKVDVQIEEGLEVIIDGKITVYTGRSSYQITVDAVEIAGEGALFKLIEDRKKKFAALGLFDASRKKAIPKFPKKIGIITSESGAVIKDIMHRIQDRFPIPLMLCPVAVQGDTASIEITNAINTFNNLSEDEKPDTLIIARGGGSLQDLMPFNEENVILAVANSTIPVISAVGHETDTMLIDYVSDLRAPTPTGAAEFAVPSKQELILNLKNIQNRLDNFSLNMLRNFYQKLELLKKRLKSPAQVINDFAQRIDEKTTRLDNAIKNIIRQKTEKLEFTKKILNSFSFKNVLKRGYAVVWNDNYNLITSKNQAENDTISTIEFYDGKIDFTQSKPKPFHPELGDKKPNTLDNTKPKSKAKKDNINPNQTELF